MPRGGGPNVRVAGRVRGGVPEHPGDLVVGVNARGGGGMKNKTVIAVVRKLVRGLWHVVRGEPFDSRPDPCEILRISHGRDDESLSVLRMPGEAATNMKQSLDVATTEVRVSCYSPTNVWTIRGLYPMFLV